MSFPMLYAPCSMSSQIRNPQSEFLIPLDYIRKDGNNFLTWVEAHNVGRSPSNKMILIR
jgi:hypothetical protein